MKFYLFVIIRGEVRSFYLPSSNTQLSFPSREAATSHLSTLPGFQKAPQNYHISTDWLGGDFPA